VADRHAIGRDDLHAGLSAGPHIAIAVAADAVCGARCVAIGEFGKRLHAFELDAINVVNPNLARGAGVGDVELFIVR